MQGGRQTERVLVTGFYGAPNVGDEVILDSIIHLLRNEYEKDVSITVASIDPEYTEKHHDVNQAIPRLKFGPEGGETAILPYIDAVRDHDLLVIGGGGLIEEPRVIKYLMMGLLGRLFNTRVFVHAVGSDSCESDVNKRLVRYSLNSFNGISTRDEQSANRLKDIGVTSPGVVSDPGFVPTSKPETPNRLDEETSPILVSVRPVGWRWVDVAEIADALDRIQKETGHDIIFCPFFADRSPSDSDMAQAVIKRMETSARSISRDVTYKEVEGLIRQSEFVIGMRLHSIILAARNSTPFVALSYHPKCEAILQQLGAENPIPCDSVDAENLTEIVLSRLDDDSFTQATQQNANQLKRKAAKSIHGLEKDGRSGSRFQFVLALVGLPIGLLYNFFLFSKDNRRTYLYLE